MNNAFLKRISLAEKPTNEHLEANERAPKGLRFRESRIKIPDGFRCNLKWRSFYGEEKLAAVKDLSRYGCRVALPSDQVNERIFTKINRATIEIDGAVAYLGPITFVNERREMDGVISLGATFEGAGCDLDALSAATGLRTLGIESDLEKVLQVSQSVLPEFKILVADLNALLQEVKQKMDIEEKRISEAEGSENHQYRLAERTISIAQSIYAPKLQTILSSFQNIVKEMPLDQEIPHKQYFRLNFQSLVKGTPFLERGIKKPLGYSGDYGMMVMLYEYADQGDSLFNRFFHRFVCSEPAAVANRNRVGFLSDILLAGYEQAVKRGAKSFKVTSVACGPAREIYEFIRFANLTREVPVQIVLIDSEPHALDYAQARLRELSLPEKTVEFIFLKEDAVTGIIQRKDFVQWIKESNFIISAGLFDYLTDRVSQKMIAALATDLSPEGEMLIGNISKRSPDVFAMDYFMDWRLILRDEPDLLSLFPLEAQNDSKVKADVISESLGLNLFLRLKREK
jgi:extracellular factor (EF) 3-hydroxypalmitic acid methyl ester biosynthesis protein